MSNTLAASIKALAASEAGQWMAAQYNAWKAATGYDDSYDHYDDDPASQIFGEWFKAFDVCEDHDLTFAEWWATADQTSMAGYVSSEWEWK
jgi:hypothetical protein